MPTSMALWDEDPRILHDQIGQSAYAWCLNVKAGKDRNDNVRHVV